MDRRSPRRTALRDELAAVKQAIHLDDERLRRALTTTVSGELTEHIARAAGGLREEVAELNQLRIVQAEQVRELEASNVLLEALASSELRGGIERGAAPARWLSQLHELTRLETARQAGLQEEKRILRTELARIREECQAVSRGVELERSRQQQAQDECRRLQAALEHAASGSGEAALRGLISEVQELKAGAQSAQLGGRSSSASGHASTARRSGNGRRASPGRHSRRRATARVSHVDSRQRPGIGAAAPF